MKSRPFLVPLLALFYAAATNAETPQPWTDDDFNEVSGPVSPHVAYAVRQDGDSLIVVVDVAPIEPGGTSTVKLGLQAARSLILDQTKARVSHNGEMTRYGFVIPSTALISSTIGWEKLRMGLAVAWPGGLGAPVAESGFNVIQLTLAGEKTGHVSFPTLVGLGKLFMAADADGFYAIMEGTPSYEPFTDLPDGQWQFRRPLNVLHWKADGTPRPYDGARGEKVIAENLLVGKGPHGRSIRKPPNNLAGAAILDGKLYISLKQENRIVIMNTLGGTIAGEIKLQDPGLISSDGKKVLVAFSGSSLVRIDPTSLETSPLFTPQLSRMPTTHNPEEPLYGKRGTEFGRAGQSRGARCANAGSKADRHSGIGSRHQAVGRRQSVALRMADPLGRFPSALSVC